MSSKTRMGVDTPQMEAFRDLMRVQYELGRLLDHELQQEVGLSTTELTNEFSASIRVI